MDGFPELQPYVMALRGVPQVEAVEVEGVEAETAQPDDRPRRSDALIRLELADGTSRRLEVALKRSHLSYELADRVSEGLGARADRVLFAPHIGGPLGRYLAERGVNFVDASGNCHLRLGDGVFVWIEGRSPAPREPRGRGVRAPGYEALFAFLAKPALIDSPVREVAEEAGVSRQAVSDMRRRLVDEGLVVRKGRAEYAWVPHQMRHALERWLSGYLDVVRPKLLVGRFRARETDVEALERRVTEELGSEEHWCWGGSTAGYRLTRYYRSGETVLHVADGLIDAPRRLRALPARDGNLVVLRLPGPVALEGLVPNTAHPLLVYSEMLAEGSERAREAAEEVLKLYEASIGGLDG
jgi:hypothetical protein